MKLVKETILGVLITELADITGISAAEFLAKYEDLFGKYADYHILMALAKDNTPTENWEAIQKAKRLALGNCNAEKGKIGRAHV